MSSSKNSPKKTGQIPSEGVPPEKNSPKATAIPSVEDQSPPKVETFWAIRKSPQGLYWAVKISVVGNKVFEWIYDQEDTLDIVAEKVSLEIMEGATGRIMG